MLRANWLRVWFSPDSGKASSPNIWK